MINLDLLSFKTWFLKKWLIFIKFHFSSNQFQRLITLDVIHELYVSLEDLSNGKDVKLKISRNAICPICEGNGCQQGKYPTSCFDCKGRGRKKQIFQTKFIITQQEITCPTCQGEGISIHPNDRCNYCKGQKVTHEAKLISVHIERGMKDGDHIVVHGVSDEAPGLDTGDLIIIIRQKKNNPDHPLYADLLINQNISLT